MGLQPLANPFARTLSVFALRQLQNQHIGAAASKFVRFRARECFSMDFCEFPAFFFRFLTVLAVYELFRGEIPGFLQLWSKSSQFRVSGPWTEPAKCAFVRILSWPAVCYSGLTRTLAYIEGELTRVLLGPYSGLTRAPFFFNQDTYSGLTRTRLSWYGGSIFF